MNKSDLVNALSSTQGITKAQATKNVDAFLSVVSKELSAGKTVQLVGFGSLNVVTTSARKGRNPRTGEPLKIAASKKVKFNTSAALRKALNSKKPAKRK